MRLLIAILIPVALFSSVYGYIRFADRVRPKPVQKISTPDDGRWTASLFNTRELNGNSDYDEPAAEVTLGGQSVFRQTQKIPPQSLSEFDLTNVQQGANTLFVSANTGAANSDDTSGSIQPTGVRIRIYRDDRLKADETIWIDSGDTRAVGQIPFQAPVGNKP